MVSEAWICIYIGVFGMDRSQLLMADNSEKKKGHYPCFLNLSHFPFLGLC